MFDMSRLCMNCMRGILSGNYCGFCGSPPLQEQELATALPLRTVLNGRYLTGKMLGAGGFGVTYIGYDLAENKRIAIKEFMPSGLVRRVPGQTVMQVTSKEKEFTDSMQRFLEEARMIYHYQKNPHILQVYSLFQENGTAYYVMEFLEGCDLKHFLKKRGGVLSWQELMPIVLQVIDALQVMHRDGVVHRDISPDNIYISPAGKATLIDFGAARLVLAQKQLTVILKRKYAPIEQYESSGKQGPWTDIYALAATMYYCLTGKLPPEAPERIYRDELKSFRQLGIVLDSWVEKAIYHALRVEADARYQSAAEFRNGILNIRNQARLICIQGMYEGMEIALERVMTVGRNPSCCQLIYPGAAKGISGVHCKFMVDEEGVPFVIDLGSTYGTWVNGEKTASDSYRRLSDGDNIVFGENQIWRISL